MALGKSAASMGRAWMTIHSGAPALRLGISP
jgi:hypothetical protein